MLYISSSIVQNLTPSTAPSRFCLLLDPIEIQFRAQTNLHVPYRDSALTHLLQDSLGELSSRFYLSSRYSLNYLGGTGRTVILWWVFKTLKMSLTVSFFTYWLYFRSPFFNRENAAIFPRILPTFPKRIARWHSRSVFARFQCNRPVCFPFVRFNRWKRSTVVQAPW